MIYVAIIVIIILLLISPIIFVIISLIYVFGGKSKRKEWTNQDTIYKNNQYKNASQNVSIGPLEKYPYQKKRILTQTEHHFYQILKEECDERGLLIFPKVRMEDYIDVTIKAEKQKYRGYIKSRHIDFLICDKELNIITGLELDDDSHNNPNAQKTDALKNKIFEVINIPLIRVNVKSGKYRIQIINILDYCMNHIN